MKQCLEKLSAECCSNFAIHNCAMKTTDVFDNHGDMNIFKLYIVRFQKVPNSIHLDEINCKAADKWFSENYRDKITDYCYQRRRVRYKDEQGDYLCYFLFEDLLLYFNGEYGKVTFLYRKTDSALVETIASAIKRFKKRKTYRKPEIELLVSGLHGFDTKTMDISKPKLAIEDNYNDGFLSIHEAILKRLRKKNDKGLLLLHGKPGTGKTSYIRYLITQVKKNVIFLPPNMAACITDPGLMGVLIDNPNSIFVIEDAENIIVDRNNSGSSSVSALLNLADGLLSDCLNIQIICSFNTDLSRVDSALMRKGRLIAKYEFAELETHKAQALSNKLGFSSVITSPMTLAAVYNQNDMEFAATTYKKAIGF